MGSVSLAAARPAIRTVTTIPLQLGGLRGKNEMDPASIVEDTERKRFHSQMDAQEDAQTDGRADKLKPILKKGKGNQHIVNYSRVFCYHYSFKGGVRSYEKSAFYVCVVPYENNAPSTLY